MKLPFIVFFCGLSLLCGAEELNDYTEFAYIGGGDSKSTNYSTLEANLTIFRSKLFGDRGAVLSALGARSPLASVSQAGYLERRPNGMVAPYKDSELKFPIDPAVKTKLRGLFYGYVNSLPARVTLVYGTHGTKDGMTLWNGEVLAREELHSLHKELPDQITVRSVHHHCNASSAVIDPARKSPVVPAEWKPFLEANYRKKSCALAVSTDGNTAYPGESCARADLSWEKLLAESNPPTLAALKAALVKSEAETTIPSTTSDYLSEDLYRFFCEAPPPTPAPVAAGPDPAAAAPAPVVAATPSPATVAADAASQSPAPVIEDPCSLGELKKELETASKDLKKAWKGFGEARGLASRQAKEKAAASKPDAYKGYIEARKQIDKLRAEFITAHKDKAPTPEAEQELEAKLEALRATGKDFEAAFAVDSAAAEAKAAAVREVQKRRQQVLLQMQIKYREAAEKFLSDDKKIQASPELKKVKEYYDEIKKCEESALS